MPSTDLDWAKEWLARNEKHPVQTDDGRWWRWNWFEPPNHEGMADLPKEVFNCLAGGDTYQPWLYGTRERAMSAVVLAVDAARRNGWRPGEDK